MQPGAVGASETSTARVAELEAEIQDLREQLGKAKGINDVMWETVVQKVMAQEKQKAVTNDRDDAAPTSTCGLMNQDDVERPRKKGKKIETKK